MLRAVSQLLSPHQSAISKQPTHTTHSVYTVSCVNHYTNLHPTLLANGRFYGTAIVRTVGLQLQRRPKRQALQPSVFETGEEEFLCPCLSQGTCKTGTLTLGICCLGSAEHSSYYPTSITMSVISRTWKSAKNAEVLKPRSSKHTLCSLSPTQGNSQTNLRRKEKPFDPFR